LGGRQRFPFAFQPDDFRFEGNEPVGKLLDTVPCADGADNQPDCQRNRNSKNDQDDENDAGFHNFILAAERLIARSLRLVADLWQAAKAARIQAGLL
jgi:hypothetical protein